MNIYKSNSYRKDLNWLHFNNETGSKEAASERLTVLHMHFCSWSNNFKWQLGAPGKTWQQYSMHGHIEIQSNLRRKKHHRTNQGSNFFGGSFSNRYNVTAPIQFGSKSQLQHAKRWIFLKNRPIGFPIIAPVLSHWSNETSWLFPALKPTYHFLPQSRVSCRSDSSSEANSSCCHRSDAWSHFNRVASSA